MRAVKPRRWFVQRDIQLLIRTFPCETITIRRNVRLYGDLGEVLGFEETVIYKGEALVIPSGGAVADYGLGQVENMQPQLLVPGNRKIEQGDFVSWQGRQFQVSFQPNAWHAFVQIRLEQYEQGA